MLSAEQPLLSRSFDCFSPVLALPLSCSRGSPYLVLPSPVNYSFAAMCVQPRALGYKVIQYIVLYCLTPPLFRRYSWINLWSPSPAWDGFGFKRASYSDGGIRLVNRPGRRRTGNWP